MVTPRLIHTLLSKSGMTDAEYRTLLRSKFGVSSCKDLSEPDARLLASILRGKLPKKQQYHPRQSDTASKIWYLFYYLQDITGAQRQSSYLVGMIRKALGEEGEDAVSLITKGPMLDLDALGPRYTWKVIESLKRRIAYEEAK